MKKNKCISYYFLIKCTAETFFSWLIYIYKLTTSKTFSFFPLLE
ncbi:dihydropteroate synthase [Listeria monocytogenes]|nr:dihydropteroate synthase [Listeria monocytogenes]EAF1535587.1 dihydropteroate synthase [Listeria monocytogenes]EAF5294292.1 dihydropteroate synthase [Listeria monocytogenes]EAG0268256.1 dihydropteroate synthase [Listeria monocytogenes]EAW7100220.1 dihydropteroate synthase [Listeria monocytogenes]